MQVPLPSPSPDPAQPPTVLDAWDPPLRRHYRAESLVGFEHAHVLVDFDWEKEAGFGPGRFPHYKLVRREIKDRGDVTVVLTAQDFKKKWLGVVGGRLVCVFRLDVLRTKRLPRHSELGQGTASDEAALMRAAGAVSQVPTLAELLASPEQVSLLSAIEARAHLPTLLQMANALAGKATDLSGVEFKHLAALFTGLAQRGLTPEDAEAALGFLEVSPDLRQRWLSLNLAVVKEDLATHLLEEDIVALGKRKRELAVFARMLSEDEPAFFESLKVEAHGAERAWQRFFERNTWIFGYSLHFGFFVPVGKKLEETIVGGAYGEDEKRADALLKSAGDVRFACFVEIKSHLEDLLDDEKYRSGCFAPSRELTGAVAQVQGTAQAAITRREGARISELNNAAKTVAYLVQPRCVVVAGHTRQLARKDEPDARARSFEVYRRQMVNPEVVTYDELYDRARNIVEHVERVVTARTPKRETPPAEPGATRPSWPSAAPDPAP